MVEKGADFNDIQFVRELFANYSGGQFDRIVKYLIRVGLLLNKLGSSHMDKIGDGLL